MQDCSPCIQLMHAAHYMSAGHKLQEWYACVAKSQTAWFVVLPQYCGFSETTGGGGYDLNSVLVDWYKDGGVSQTVNTINLISGKRLLGCATPATRARMSAR